MVMETGFEIVATADVVPAGRRTRALPRLADASGHHPVAAVLVVALAMRLSTALVVRFAFDGSLVKDLCTEYASE